MTFIIRPVRNVLSSTQLLFHSDSAVLMGNQVQLDQSVV